MLALRIKEKATELGFDGCGITTAKAPESSAFFQQWLSAGYQGEMHYLQRNAEKRVDPQKVLPGAKSMIVLASSYFQSDASPPLEGQHGVIARYARYDDYHHALIEPLKKLSVFLQELGGPDVKSLWYIDTGPILERDFAHRSGLGFVGKHTNVISRRLGNWFFLSEILTTLEVEGDASEKNHCGKCVRCLESCPTEALRGPFQLDARRCISYLTIELKGSIPEEFRSLVGNRIYGCDDCLAACPWNRFAKAGALMKPFARPDLDQPALLDLLRLDEMEFKKKFKGTPMLRTKRRGILRNVCVALGNIGNRTALPELEKALQDPEPLIREHAAWAIRRIGEREQTDNLA